MSKTVYDLLIGQKVKVMTDMKVEVELEIESLERKSRYHQITPDTRENDWYGEGYHSYWFEIKFTNGSTKSYDSITDIKLED